MKVCIEQEEGGFTVEIESEAMPGQPTTESEQTFATLDEVIDFVRQQFAGDTTAEPKPMMEGEAEFVQGFKQARGGEGMGY